MRTLPAIAVLLLVTIGCGDNARPPSTSFSSPAGFSAVGGAQVAHSKSFMLVTSVAMSPQPTISNSTVRLESALGAQ